MTIMFSSITLLWLIGLAIMVIELRDAPEAYEDERGFNVVWRNHSPKAQDICCIWTDGGMTPATA